MSLLGQPCAVLALPRCESADGGVQRYDARVGLPLVLAADWLRTVLALNAAPCSQPAPRADRLFRAPACPKRSL